MGTDLFDRPSTIDTGTRQAFDLYETPDWMTAALLRHHPIAGTVLEPCAGDGAIVRVLEPRAAIAAVLTNDIDPRHAATFHHDACGAQFWADPALTNIDWVVTNPPFTVAIHVLEHAVRCARVGVAMLLRKTFLEPTGKRGAPKPADRGPWLAAHPPTHVIGLPRHKFRRDAAGTDSVSADWMIWRRGELADLYRTARPFIIDHAAKDRAESHRP
jgi:hypothetical protein